MNSKNLLLAKISILKERAREMSSLEVFLGTVMSQVSRLKSITPSTCCKSVDL
jgi:hypothetical protein